MTDTDADAEWSFESARVPAGFAHATELGGSKLDHAWGPGHATLCGLPEDEVEVFRHWFDARHPGACPRCRDLAAAAPTVPSTQEKLHDLVLTAAPGPHREQLLHILRRGAQIRSWINMSQLHVGHYLDIGSLTDGAQQVTDLFAALAPGHQLSIARVPHHAGEFVVILPEQEPALIARAAAA
jgi:hypothetical protein